MKFLLIALTFATSFSTLSYAQYIGPTGDGKTEAYAVCSTVAFESDRTACMMSVNNANYFQLSLVSMCDSRRFSEEKAACIGLIADQVADEPVVNLCRTRTFWDDMRNCIQPMLHPYRPVVVGPPAPTPAVRCDKDYMLRVIDKAIAAVRVHISPGELMNALNELRNHLGTCTF